VSIHKKKMAKKMKLEPTLAESVQKVLDIQDLMLTPEAKKMQTLDQEMQAILENKSLSHAEKIRKFELTLGEFRHVQDKIIEQGTTSLADRFRNDSWKEEMRDLLQTMIDETVARNVQNHSSVATYDSSASGTRSIQDRTGSESTSGQADVASVSESVPVAMSTPAAVKRSAPRDDDQPMPESPPSAIFSTPVTTPTNVPTDSPPAAGSLWNDIERHLRAGGAKEKGGRYLFPILDSPTRLRLKKQHQDYASSTFQKVLSVLTSNEAQGMPGNASGLVEHIKKILMPARGVFAKYFDDYPNLEQMLNRPRVVDFKNWTSFHGKSPASVGDAGAKKLRKK
jgi:hypothetical protein